MNPTTPAALAPSPRERLERHARELKFAALAVEEARIAVTAAERMVRDLLIAAGRAQRDAS